MSWLLIVMLTGGCIRSSDQGTPTLARAAPRQTPAGTPSAPPAPASSTPTVEPEVTSTPTATIPSTRTAISTATFTATPSATVIASPTLELTPDGVVRTVRVPILMYHYISKPSANADVYRRDLSVTPTQFESHLKYLADAGYQTISLDALLYALAQGQSLPLKPVILTFDDGYEDNYTNAFPVLQKFGMVGHFFIISDFINQGRPGYMTWPQIEEMAAAGQRFGSHSRDHPDLSGKDVDYLVWQALGGKEAIEEHLGYHPRWISYPAGRYDAQAIAVYKSAGYWGGLVTAQGATHTLDHIFDLKRVRVRGSHTAEDLGRLLVLDW